MGKPCVGVLALQGAFREHAASVARLGAETREVRQLKDMDGIDAMIIPGGESNAGFARRVEQGVQSLLRKYDGELVVVCHGGTIRRAMSALFSDSGMSFWDWKAEPCGGYLVDFRNGAPISYQSI